MKIKYLIQQSWRRFLVARAIGVEKKERMERNRYVHIVIQSSVNIKGTTVTFAVPGS
jgi:hypothetical protein